MSLIIGLFLKIIFSRNPLLIDEVDIDIIPIDNKDDYIPPQKLLRKTIDNKKDNTQNLNAMY